MSVCEAGRCVTPVVDLPAQVGPSCASYLHGFGSTGLRFQLFPTAWKNRATQLSSTSYTIFSAHSSSDASKSMLNVHSPPKKEYVLYAPLSARQREVYDAVVKGSLRGLLASARPGEDARQS